MDSLSQWKADIAGRSGPIYLAIADALADAIAAGRLKPGARLPTQRELAAALGIDFTTVTRAYSAARARGLLDARSGQGTFVRLRAMSSAGPGSDGGASGAMGMNSPPEPDDVDLREHIRHGVAHVLTQPGADALMRYQDPGGHPPDRDAALLWLSRRLGQIAADRVLVTGGAQNAVFVLLSTLLSPGDAVCTEALTFSRFKTSAAQLRLRLVGLAMDSHGILPAAFEASCRHDKPKLLYCVPTISNPTTATMPASRRQQIAAIARKYGVSIIEDDAYGYLPRSSPPPLATFAPEITYYVASLSKCLTPALRVAYMAVPSPVHAARAVAGLRATILMAAPLMTALLSRWIAVGTAERILAAIQREAIARQKLAASILPAASIAAQPEGHHLWLALPADWDRRNFAATLGQAGVAIVPSDAFAVSHAAPNAVRISLGAAPNREALKRILGLVARTMATGPAQVSAVV
jgi:DNA-binding transcriptional MocR family regulator